MTRHGRNCTAGAVYTYHEKQKDMREGSYGTLAARLNKDALPEFDCCCLTLQPCRNPVITPDGFLYDKEAVLEYIVQKKLENAKAQKAYEAEQKKDAKRLEELAREEKRSQTEAFVKNEQSIVGDKFKAGDMNREASGSGVSNMSGDRAKQLPSFWIPALTPKAEKAKTEKPSSQVFCPMSGKPLKAKDLIEIKFTLVPDDGSKKSLIAKTARYMCAVTHDVLNNATPCAVLRTSGSVVTVECVERIIKKDMIDPTNGKHLTDKDIVYMQRGGTGFASVNDKLEAKIKKPVISV